MLIEAGTNDMVSHSDLTPVLWAVIEVDVTLQSRGPHGDYLTIFPMGYGSAHPDAWVPVLSDRSAAFNRWLRAMAAGGAFKVSDMAGTLHEGRDGVITAELAGTGTDYTRTTMRR